MSHGLKVEIVACRDWQVVYQDLRQALLEEVYRHSVQQARLGPVLEQLDEALGTLCEATPKELHAGVRRSLSLPTHGHYVFTHRN